MNDFENNEYEKSADVNRKTSKNRPYKKGTFIGVGVALGVVYGIIFDNIAIGMSIGIAVGVAIDSSMMNKNKKQQ